jgi:hypothetical protein
MRLLLALALVICAATAGCGRERWLGIAYPNKHEITTHLTSGVYQTLEECRAATLRLLQGVSSIQAGDYECGLNCEVKAGLSDLYICERTER